MGEFSKIERSFWETDEAREMTPEEKYFWLYLRTNANVNTLGCYTFRMRKAMDETGYNRETLEKLLKRMEECGYIFYCAETGEVLLLGWGAQNWNKGTGVKRALAADIKGVKSGDLRKTLEKLLEDAGLLPLLPAFGNGNAEQEDGRIAAPPTARQPQNGGRTEGKPRTVEDNEGQPRTNEDNEGQTGTTLAEKEREKEKEKEKILSRNSAEFSAFWAAYPNRKNKQQAAKAWDKLKITPEKYRAIMDGLERAKASMEWAKDGGEFIPYPSTWLNAGGWENEYKPLRPSSSQTPPTPPLYSGPAAVSQPFAERTGPSAKPTERPVPPDDALERRRRLAGAYKTEAQRADSSVLAEGNEVNPGAQP